MTAIILGLAVRLSGKTIFRFSPELRCADVDPPGTLPAEEFIPQFAHSTRRSSSQGNRTNIRLPEAMMTLFVTTSHQVPQENAMEPLISMPEENTDDDNDQKSDDKELVILRTRH
jgi:hypothetical protein